MDVMVKLLGDVVVPVMCVLVLLFPAHGLLHDIQ